MLLVAAAMLLPPLLAWGEHIYLRHGEVSGKRRVLYLLLYFVLIHAVVFGAAYVRGLYFQMVTLDYAIRHLGFGLICALIAPFFLLSYIGIRHNTARTSKIQQAAFQGCPQVQPVCGAFGGSLSACRGG